MGSKNVKQVENRKPSDNVRQRCQHVAERIRQHKGDKPKASSVDNLSVGAASGAVAEISQEPTEADGPKRSSGLAANKRYTHPDRPCIAPEHKSSLVIFVRAAVYEADQSGNGMSPGSKRGRADARPFPALANDVQRRPPHQDRRCSAGVFHATVACPDAGF